jgi:hypothetical protein
MKKEIDRVHVLDLEIKVCFKKNYYNVRDNFVHLLILFECILGLFAIVCHRNMVSLTITLTNNF